MFKLLLIIVALTFAVVFVESKYILDTTYTETNCTGTVVKCIGEYINGDASETTTQKCNENGEELMDSTNTTALIDALDNTIEFYMDETCTGTVYKKIGFSDGCAPYSHPYKIGINSVKGVCTSGAGAIQRLEFYSSSDCTGSIVHRSTFGRIETHDSCESISDGAFKVKVSCV